MDQGARNSFIANVVFVGALYVGLVHNVVAISNLCAVVIWLMLVTYISLFLSERAERRIRQTPWPFDLATDIASFTLLCWYGWAMTAAAYTISALLMERMYAANSSADDPWLKPLRLKLIHVGSFIARPIQHVAAIMAPIRQTFVARMLGAIVGSGILLVAVAAPLFAIGFLFEWSAGFESALNERCEIGTIHASVYEKFSPEKFWRIQLDSQQRRIAALQQPSELARIRKQVASQVAEAYSDMSQQNPSLFPPKDAEQLQVDQLRQKADDIEFERVLRVEAEARRVDLMAAIQCRNRVLIQLRTLNVEKSTRAGS